MAEQRLLIQLDNVWGAIYYFLKVGSELGTCANFSKSELFPRDNLIGNVLN